jgi:hypothetical protein
VAQRHRLAVASTRIDRLCPEDIEDGYAAMLAAGHAPAHLVKVHALLSSVLAVEAARGNIPRNPCARELVSVPEIPLAEKRSLTRAEARAVLETIGTAGTLPGGGSASPSACARARRSGCGGSTPTWTAAS